MDYIFLIGPSAVGKTTLAKGLFAHYQGVYIEQNMVPEFAIPADTEDIGDYEETMCWENIPSAIQKSTVLHTWRKSDTRLAANRSIH